MKGSLREGILRKTTVLLDFVQITSHPSPQIWTTYTFFSDVEIQDLKISLGLKKHFYIMIYYIYIQPKKAV